MMSNWDEGLTLRRLSENINPAYSLSKKTFSDSSLLPLLPFINASVCPIWLQCVFLLNELFCSADWAHTSTYGQVK